MGKGDEALNDVEMEINYDQFLLAQNMSPKSVSNQSMTSNPLKSPRQSNISSSPSFQPTAWQRNDPLPSSPIFINDLGVDDIPCGANCLADYGDHWLKYSHPGDTNYYPVAKPECDLHNECPFQHDSFHTDRYTHSDTERISHPSRSKEYDPIPSENERDLYYKSRDKRILAERYAKAKLLYPQVNIDDEFMLMDKRDKNPYNQKLKDQVIKEADTLNPMLPIDESILPRKNETDRLYKLRIASIQERKESKIAKMRHDMPLYNKNDPLERHRYRMEQKENERRRKRLANAEIFKTKRKDFEGLRILYVNLNDPEVQLPRVFALYHYIDIFVFTELDIDRDLLLRRTLTPPQYAVFTHKGVPYTVNGVKLQKVYSAIFIKESQGRDNSSIFERRPLILPHRLPQFSNCHWHCKNFQVIN